MPLFKFQGRDQSGKLISGERNAQSIDSVSSQLFREGITPTQIVEKKSKQAIGVSLKKIFEKKQINNTELALFTRQMYTLNKAGVPISIAIKNLAKTARTPRLAQILLGLSESLESGRNLAQSMEAYPQVFTPLIISMVRIGQNTGKLDNAFLRLTEYLELETGTIKRVKAAIRYPAFVLSAIVIGIIIINIFVIPAFGKVYAKANVPLPKLTVILINISNFFTDYWLVMLAILAGIGLWTYRYLQTATGKYKWHKLQLSLPVVGKLIRRMILLRFSQTFSIVVESGLSVNEGLLLVAQSINNQYARSEIITMQNLIQRGSSIYQAAASCHLFTNIELQMLAISEETGELGAMLNEIAAYYQREVEYDLKHLTDVMEPLLLIAIATMVLLLALAVYMPIWNMVNFVNK